MAKKKTDMCSTDLIMKTLNDVYGVGSGIMMSETQQAIENSIETGIAAFDYGLIGIGGIPPGQFVQIYGKEGAGKTTLMLHIMAGMQRAGRICIVLDQKCAVASDIHRAKRIGIDPAKVVIIPFDAAEDAFEKARLVIQGLEKGKAAFFWDDLGLAPSKSDIVEVNTAAKRKKSDEKKKEIAEKARAMWRFCQSLNGLCYKADVPMIIVNQLIADIGKFGFGPKVITSGGGGIRFASRINISLAKGGAIKSGENVIGNVVYAKTDKNAFFMPHRKVQLHLDFRRGFLSFESTLLNADRALAKYAGKYKCPAIGVSDYISIEELQSKHLMALEALLWPWAEDPQGYDMGESSGDSEGFDDDSEGYSALVDEFFG